MTANDLGYFALGMAVPLTIKALALFFTYKEQVNEVVDGNDIRPRNPDPEVAYDYSTREARRVERPLYERSVPGVVVREVNIDSAHLRGARAE